MTEAVEVGAAAGRGCTAIIIGHSRWRRLRLLEEVMVELHWRPQILVGAAMAAIMCDVDKSRNRNT